MRYERKYRIDSMGLAEIRNIIDAHPASFRPHYPDRRVNNIYLDTPGLEFMRENLAGVAQRRKFRIRWYGEDLADIVDPVLEVKIKDGELGEKVTARMTGFRLGEYAGLPRLLEEGFARLRRLPAQAVPALAGEEQPLPANERVPRPMQPLRPVLINSYQRTYLISFDGKFRLTIDREMRFYRADPTFGMPVNPITDEAIVVEIKYDRDLDAEYHRIGQYLPFRLGKNSKYVNGMLLVGNV